MVLGIDGSRLVGPRTGVGRHLQFILEAWSRQELPFREVRVYAHEPVPDLPEHPSLRLEILPARNPGLGWQLRSLRPHASGTDLFLGSYSLPPGVRTTCALLNMGILEGPFVVPGLRARLRSRHYAWSTRRADLVLAISSTTKGDLVRHYRADASRIRVVRPGLAPAFRRSGPGSGLAERLIGAPARYVLFVGKLSARRHVPELIRAVAQVPDLHLLLVGPNTGHVDVVGSARVTHVEYLESEELGELYRGAVAFVLPSEREGFGHTVVEAMGCGCPVVVLRDAELGVFDWAGVDDQDDLAFRLPDARAETLAGALRQLAADDALRTRLSVRGLRYAATFPTWDEHAVQVLDGLRAVIA